MKQGVFFVLIFTPKRSVKHVCVTISYLTTTVNIKKV